MKLLVISDLHLDAKTAGFPRFDDVEGAMWAAAERAIDWKADAFLCLGDVSDPDSPEMIRAICAVNRIGRELHRELIPSYWVVGNHDTLEDGHGTTVLDPVSYRVVKTPHLVAFKRGPRTGKLTHTTGPGDKTIGFLPYTSLSHTYDPAEVVRSWHREGTRVDLIAGHLMLEGLGHGSETTDYPRGRDVFFPIDVCRELYPDAVLLCGHYHAAQTYRGVHIPGSLVNLTKAERDHTPGWLEIEI